MSRITITLNPKLVELIRKQQKIDKRPSVTNTLEVLILEAVAAREAQRKARGAA
jgi:hypothetical protein